MTKVENYSILKLVIISISAVAHTPLTSLIAFGKIAISLSLISHVAISKSLPILPLAFFMLGLALLLITL